MGYSRAFIQVKDDKRNALRGMPWRFQYLKSDLPELQ